MVFLCGFVAPENIHRYFRYFDCYSKCFQLRGFFSPYSFEVTLYKYFSGKSLNIPRPRLKTCS